MDTEEIVSAIDDIDNRLRDTNRNIGAVVVALSAIAERIQPAPKEFDLTAVAALLMAVLVNNACGETEDDFSISAAAGVTGAIALRDALAAHTEKASRDQFPAHTKLFSELAAEEDLTAVAEVSTATQNKPNACFGAGEPNCFSASNDPLQAQPPRSLQESEAV